MEIANIKEVVERLKVSKTQYEVNEEDRGNRAGHHWACAEAEYSDLLAISDLGLEEYGSGHAASVDDALGNDWRNGESLWMDDEGDRVEHPSDNYVLAFVQSARLVFAEVKDRL
jgi:hypothetical protein